jgi:hypothetical protein
MVGYTSNVYLINLETLDKIAIQFTPTEISVESTSNDVAIASMGRNHPLYQYTGGDESIEFEIEWVANDEDLMDVQRGVSWLKANSKNDGYANKKPRVALLWGSELFNDAVWIISSCSYTYRLPQKGRDYFFMKAIQRVVLKKVTAGNYTHDDLKNHRL